MGKKPKPKLKKSSGPRKVRYYILPIWMFDMLYPKLASTFRIDPDKSGPLFVYDESDENPFTQIVNTKFPLMIRISKCFSVFDVSFTTRSYIKDEECRNKKLDYYELPLLKFEEVFPRAAAFYLIREKISEPENVIVRFDETFCLPERADLDIENEEFLFYSGKCLNPNGEIPDIPDFQERTTEELVKEMAEKMNFPDPETFDRKPEDIFMDSEWAEKWHKRTMKYYRRNK